MHEFTKADIIKISSLNQILYRFLSQLLTICLAGHHSNQKEAYFENSSGKSIQSIRLFATQKVKGLERIYCQYLLFDRFFFGYDLIGKKIADILSEGKKKMTFRLKFFFR